MGSRLSLQHKLEELLGSSNVYYDPPESIKLSYPAIIYSKTDIFDIPADNIKYSLVDRYQIMVIDKRPDNPIIKQMLQWEYCTFDRSYVADNLHHDVLNIYY